MCMYMNVHLRKCSGVDMLQSLLRYLLRQYVCCRAFLMHFAQVKLDRAHKLFVDKRPI
jgi:hypothetical protein